METAEQQKPPLHPAVKAFLKEIQARGGRAGKGKPKNRDRKEARANAIRAAEIRWKDHVKKRPPRKHRKNHMSRKPTPAVPPRLIRPTTIVGVIESEVSA